MLGIGCVLCHNKGLGGELDNYHAKEITVTAGQRLWLEQLVLWFEGGDLDRS